jgi:regulator of sirC expression with transglutaminase-like and TPR domain
VIESHSRRRFSELVSRPDEAVDLAEAALLIACEEYPELDVSRYLAQLDEMGAAFRGRVGANPGPVTLVRVLNGYLFEEEGFRGNDQDYYDPRNSFLNDVLDRKTGIPITLSTVYMEVARRAGLVVDGVGLPGHFIVKVTGPRHDILIDPFHRGALLSEEDCQRRLDRVYGRGKVKMEPQMLARVDRKHVLARMLRNLKAIYMKREDHARALSIVDLLLRVNPHSGEDLRDRGLLYAALDCYAPAAKDLEAYLALLPGAPEAGTLQEKVAEMRQKAARVH